MIGSIYEAGATEAELAYLWPGGMTPEEYERLRDTLPGRVDAIGLFRLYQLRGNETEADRYLAMMDPEDRRLLSGAGLDLVPVDPADLPKRRRR